MLRSAPRALRAIVQLGLLVVIVAAALLYAPPIGAVTAKTLQYSLEREANGRVGSGRACARRSAGVWRCVVLAAGVSARAEYQLTRRGRRCWDVVKLEPGSVPSLPDSLSGCAKLRDQVRV